MKNVLLIGGGGTLGTYTAKELLRLGHKVDIICLEDKASDNENLAFYKGEANLEYLESILKNKSYDGIVNFIHYPNVEEYPPIHSLLISHTNHLIILSSYRVYADEQHPVTETAPMLLDVSADKDFIETEKYAISKAKLEKYLNKECKGQNWTIVRPVISFSDRRFDINMVSGHIVVDAAKKEKKVCLPLEAKNLTAGLDWAGNSGKLIANLLFKKCAIGEAYTISTAQNLTWSQVADIYTDLLNVKFEWIPANYPNNTWHWYYDRVYDREIDNSKVLKATGLTSSDFKSIKEGVRIELKKLGAI